jgi:hypothetical protein
MHRICDRIQRKDQTRLVGYDHIRRDRGYYGEHYLIEQIA